MAKELGKIVRPQSPTKNCTVRDEDKSHIGLILVESKVTDKKCEKILCVRSNEIVCALSSKTKYIANSGQVISNIDLPYYWCNFCSFKTEDKHLLLKHLMGHRFSCPYCVFQTFSRVDVVRHAVTEHEKYEANDLKYCVLLPDLLKHGINEDGKKGMDSHLEENNKMEDSFSVKESDDDKFIRDTRKRKRTTEPVPVVMEKKTRSFFKNLSSANEKKKPMLTKSASNSPEETGMLRRSKRPSVAACTAATTGTSTTSTSSAESVKTVKEPKKEKTPGVCFECSVCKFRTFKKAILTRHTDKKHKGTKPKFALKIVSESGAKEIEASDSAYKPGEEKSTEPSPKIEPSTSQDENSDGNLADPVVEMDIAQEDAREDQEDAREDQEDAREDQEDNREDQEDNREDQEDNREDQEDNDEDQDDAREEQEAARSQDSSSDEYQPPEESDDDDSDYTPEKEMSKTVSPKRFQIKTEPVDYQVAAAAGSQACDSSSGSFLQVNAEKPVGNSGGSADGTNAFVHKAEQVTGMRSSELNINHMAHAGLATSSGCMAVGETATVNEPVTNKPIGSEHRTLTALLQPTPVPTSGPIPMSGPIPTSSCDQETTVTDLEEANDQNDIVYKCLLCTKLNGQSFEIVKRHYRNSHPGGTLVMGAVYVSSQVEKWLYFCISEGCTFSDRMPEKWLQHTKTCLEDIYDNLDPDNSYDSSIINTKNVVLESFMSVRKSGEACLNRPDQNPGNSQVGATIKKEITIKNEIQDTKMSQATPSVSSAPPLCNTNASNATQRVLLPFVYSPGMRALTNMIMINKVTSQQSSTVSKNTSTTDQLASTSSTANTAVKSSPTVQKTSPIVQKPSSTSVDKNPVPLRPSTSVDKNPVPLRPSTSVDKNPFPLRPSTSVDNNPVPIRPSTTVDKNSVPIRPSTSVDKNPVPLRSSTQADKNPVPSTSASTGQVPFNVDLRGNYKCAHCRYLEGKVLAVKKHMVERHRTNPLYALDMAAEDQSIPRFLLFCPKDSCPFCTKSSELMINHFKTCSIAEGKDEESIEEYKKRATVTKSFITKTLPKLQLLTQ